ncbi:unnamed protein product [Tilletia laevis]|uniref:BSD domain-containing protein n=1 Tax=Tilletia laevis TaxID=157183 RepID=A0A9N8LE45_9BASI|nr:hypothetical protein CF335_g6515 [Tilletia laevis]CAD6910955.1 unnamed protein product [Tilletia laevis]CAD6915997.1 unnamed protein product [Tilletia caries]
MDVHEYQAQENATAAAAPAPAPAAAAPQQQQHGDGVPAPAPAFEAEINQLTSSLTSWWGSVTKQSQQTLDQARTHIQKQGGILNAAKSEWSKLEDHLNDAQQRARDAAFAPADADDHTQHTGPGPGPGPGPVPAPTDDDLLEASQPPTRMSSATSSVLDKKGKGRAPPSPIDHQEQGTQGDRLDNGDDDEVPQMYSADGTPILEPGTRARGAASSHNRNSASIDLNAVAKEAQTQASQLANNATSFFSRIGSQIATDLRVADLKAITNSLSSGPPSSRAQGGVDGPNSTDSEKSAAAAGRYAITDPSSTASSGTQQNNTLPTWSATQALARKYWAEAEAVARDVGKDVRDLVNEVVQVVPPSEEGKVLPAGSSSSSSGVGISREELQDEVDKIAQEKERGASASSQRKKKSSTTGGEGEDEEDDDFDWDEGDDHAGAQASKQSKAGGKAAELSPTAETPSSASTSAPAPVPQASTVLPATVRPTTTTLPASGSSDSHLQPTTGPQTDRFEVSSGRAGADDDEEGDSDWE